MKKLSLKTQFRLGTGLILFISCMGAAFLVYNYEKENIHAEVLKEAEIYIATVQATRAYVKDVLRPRMYALVPEDEVVIEAMSTSYVSGEIMHRVGSRFNHFTYKRAARQPMNAQNLADPLESDMIGRFNTDPKLKEWTDLIDKEGRDYFARFRAIQADTSCNHCHGAHENVPRSILARYGPREAGDGFIAGDVVAVDSIYIPVDVAFGRIKRQAWLTFFMGIGFLLFLLLLFHSLFNHTVVSELRGLLSVFRGIIDRNIRPEPEQVRPRSRDEIGQLRAAFENVASDLKRTHEELRASEFKFRRLFESSREPIFICNASERLVDINSAGLALFEFRDRPEALSIETIRQLFWDARDGHHLIEAIQENGFVYNYETAIVNRTGQQRDVLVTANLRQDDQGRSDGFEGVLKDITEKKKMDKHLAQTEKLASIGQLVAGLAHEINNPLGVIQCYANLIGKYSEQESQTCADAEIIKKHSETCRRIIEDLLNFSRVSTFEKTRADVRLGLDEVLNIVEQQFAKERVHIHRRYAADLPKAVIDTERMKQIYMNLLINGRQAIGRDGDITVSADFDPDTESILIRVADTGCGISPNRIDAIFDPFFTTKKTGEGTGLGLSVSYGIVKEHGGEISVESVRGQGAIFTVSLPACRRDEVIEPEMCYAG